jgi:glycine cleavage system H lipoate-binding protein/tetratricopeptide (TPR) repeat protein
MIDRLLGVLAAAGIQPAPRELRDALWLAEHIVVPDQSVPVQHSRPGPPEVPSAELPTRSETQTGRDLTRTTTGSTGGAGELYAAGGGTELRGVVARSPAVPALRGKLELARALRPLKRRVPSRTELVVDEDATARRIADEDLWVPVFKPTTARWLNLALVVDAAPSMMVWRRTVTALHGLTDQLGAFRQVRAFTIDSSAAPDSPLTLGHELANGQPLDEPATLIDPTGRQVVLVVTDAVGNAWRDGRMGTLLRLWGGTGPTAVVSLLPQRMWSGTGLRAVPAELHTPTPGIANREWECRTHKTGQHRTGDETPIPILELSRRWLASWANLVAGDAGWQSAAVLGPAQPRQHARHRTTNEPAILVDQFRTAASPTAFQLACYLSATWLNLPVMRLVQRAMLPDSSTSHLAEVFLGGLLCRCDPTDGSTDPELAQYDFISGIREELNNYLLRDDLIKVLSTTTEFVADRFGQSFDFAALLADPEGAPLPALGAGSGRPLAYVTATVLAKLGGRYHTLVHRLTELPSDPVTPSAYTTPGEPEEPAAELRFTVAHNWVRVLGNQTIQIGITDFGINQLGDVVNVRLPMLGTIVIPEDRIGEIESTTTTTGLNIPVNGIVSDVNQAVNESPGLLSTEPYGGGWLVEITNVNLADLSALLTLAEYTELTEGTPSTLVEPRLPDPAGSRAVLIGDGNGEELTRLLAVLTDDTLVGLHADRCELLLSLDIATMHRAIRQAANETEDLLFLCISRPPLSEADLDLIRLSMTASPARVTVMIVDQLSTARGSQLNYPPPASPPEIHSAQASGIIGRLVELMRFGIPDAGPALNVEEIFQRIHSMPSAIITYTTSDPFYLTRNIAYHEHTHIDLERRIAYLSGLVESARRSSADETLTWAISELENTIPSIEDRVLRAKAWTLLADGAWARYERNGELANALQATAEAVHLHRRLTDEDPERWLPNLADALSMLSTVLVASDDIDGASSALSEAIEINRRSAGDGTSATLGRLLSRQARLHVALGRHEAALEAATEAIERLRPFARKDSSSSWDVADSLNVVGACTASLRQYTTSVSAYEEAAILYESLRTSGGPAALPATVALAECYGQLGELAVQQNSYSDAEQHHQKSLEIWERLATADPDNVDYQRHLCSTYEWLGDVAQITDAAAAARTHFQAALGVAERMAAIAPGAPTDDRRRIRDKLATCADPVGHEKTAHNRPLTEIVYALRLLPSMESLRDRNFVIRLLEDRLDPLQIDESPNVYQHIQSIVEVCVRRPDGLSALLDILRELDADTPQMHEVERLFAEWVPTKTRSSIEDADPKTSTHTHSRRITGGTLWPLVNAMKPLPCMESLQDRHFVIRVLEDRLRPLQINESPSTQQHIFSIVEACDREPDGLLALLDILRELEEGIPQISEVERLITVRGTSEAYSYTEGPNTRASAHTRSQRTSSNTLWPLIKALQRLPSMGLLQDRNFVVRLLENRLSTHLEIDESPNAQQHIFSIVEACYQRSGGFPALLDIVRELDEGTVQLREVARIIENHTYVATWPPEEREELFALLRGMTFTDLAELYRQVAGPYAPELPNETSYREIFLTLETLNTGPDGLPKPLVFVEFLAHGRHSELAIELRRWVDRQASRLGVITNLQKMRRPAGGQPGDFAVRQSSASSEEPVDFGKHDREMAKEFGIPPTKNVLFHLYGAVEASADGMRVGLGTEKERRMIVPLLLNIRRPVSYLELTDWMWDGSPSSAPDDLGHYMSDFRTRLAQLGRKGILVNRDRVCRLNVAPDQVDLHRLRTLLTEVEQLDDHTAAERLREVLALCAGEPLAGLSGHRIDGCRKTLLEERRRAEMTLIHLDFRLGHATRHSGIGEIRSLVSSDFDQVVDALLAIPCMGADQTRNLVIDMLGFSGFIRYFTKRRAHVISILRTCLDHETGLADLVTAIARVEPSDSLPVERLIGLLTDLSTENKPPANLGSHPGRPRKPVHGGEPGRSYVTALRRWPDEIARITNAELAARMDLHASRVSSLLQNNRSWKATQTLLKHALKIIEVCGGGPEDLDNWTEYHHRVATHQSTRKAPSPSPPEPVRFA